MNQKGAVHLFVVIIVLVIVAVAAYLLYQGGYFNFATPKPSQDQNTQTTPQEPTVSLKNEYENPFDKDTQYVNPFSEYKNPFDSLE